MPEKTLDLIQTVGKKLHDWRFRERSKERPIDFSRERKVGLHGGRVHYFKWRSTNHPSRVG